MARTDFFIQEGFIVKKYDKSDNDVPGLFSLTKWFKRMLSRFHVSFSDDCCVPDADDAIDSTATATVDQVNGGLITSTSAAATTITLPTATLLGHQRGTTQTLTVDNSAGANTVTVALPAGTVASSAVTGGTVLTVASGAVGVFKIYYTSATTSKISRIS